MGHATRWRLQRRSTLCGVIVLHGALIWWLLSGSPMPGPDRPTAQSVAVVLLPAAMPSRVRADPAPARHLAGMVVQLLPPLTLGELPMGAAPGAPAGGRGDGVDWAAEARRALQAFEIRSHGPPTNTSVSGESEDEWLRQLAHHAGDQVRTPGGDWIIWISADCFQVARSGANVYPTGAPAPQTFCLDRSRPTAQ